MNNSEIIKSKLSEIIENKSVSIFSIGDHYIQLACYNDNEIYFEAISHHFLGGLDKNLETSFKGLSFELDDGNYYKTYIATDQYNILKDAETIFREFYKIDYSLPFDIQDVD